MASVVDLWSDIWSHTNDYFPFITTNYTFQSCLWSTQFSSKSEVKGRIPSTQFFYV